MADAPAGWPSPADFASPPSAEDHARWAEADAAARPARLERLRARFKEAGVDAYFGTRRENSRYLTGLVLAEGEEKVAGHSGQFLVGHREVIVLADSRYQIQASLETAGSRVHDVGYDLPGGWSELVGLVGAKRVAVEAGFVSHALWRRLEAAAPDVELVPVEGWVEADRAVKEPAEIERIAASCAIADRALAALLPIIVPGASERSLALELEWKLRQGGAEAVAFDPTCLFGPAAAMPHGSPSDTALERGGVVLFDFGAQVDGYRSDMTRTLFVGPPSERDLAVYGLVAAAQSAAIDQLTATLGAEVELPTGRALEAMARGVIEVDGRWPAYRHGLGHGIGLATHEGPSLSRSAADVPLPSPTVFSVEPGIYLEGETGVRIEDLVMLDTGAGRLDRLTRFPRAVIVVG